MTKKKIIEKLEAAGIEFDPKAKADELEKLLPPEAEAPKADELSASEKASTEPPKAKKGEVVVAFLSDGVRKERVYSKEVHGEDFEDLAKEFCSHNKCL